MNKKGFTLIELLATIVVLALILSISIYVATNVIKKSKENTYNVTKHEVESNADSYLIENNGRLFYITSDNNEYEYQCITVENLIDYGYLDNDVTKSLIDENQNVKKEDYVYIERDINTKSITKSVYVTPDSKYASICPNAVKATGDIVIKVNPDDNKWSKYKDITIIYRLKNLNNQRELYKYLFNHSYSNTSTYNSNNDTFENNIKTKTVRATSNGTLLTDITFEGNKIANKTLVVSKIDTVGPVIAKGNYTGNKTVRHTVTYPLVVTDASSGVDTGSFTAKDIIVKIGTSTIDDYSLKHDGNGKYSLTINSDLYNGKVVLNISKNKVLDLVVDNVKNGNNDTTLDTGVTFDNTYKVTYDMNGGSGTIGATTYLYATSGTVALTTSKPTRTGYTFLGWNTNKNATTTSYAAGAAYNKNVLNDVTLYAIWKANTYTITYNANGGSGAPGVTTYTY
ncbi:MAG: InlB B-repeat-containing protein, partial [Bacilli bacterium]|nr:InlB B-repeat-containing protein [Bacilli bacterium]